MADQGTYVKIGDAAKTLGLTPKILVGMCERGELPPFTTFGNRKYFKREQFQKAIENLEKSQANSRKWA